MVETKSKPASQVLRFGVFQINIAARELRKHGVRVRLPGQPFSILSMLLEKPGEILTRDEMRQRLWASDTFVDFEHSMNSAIKKLRAALGDSPENSRYVETIPRVGYRFIAPVEQVGESADARGTVSEEAGRSVPLTARPTRVVQRASKILFAISAALIVFSGIWLGWSRLRSRSQGPAGKIQAGLASREMAGTTGRPVASPGSAEARDLYFKGMYYWNKRTAGAFQQAIEYFQQATAKDPNYALAYAGLANSYTLLNAYSAASAAMYIPQARAAAARALELDPNLAEAHTALALIIQNHDWDWQTSEKEYRRAIELDPNYATAHQWYAEHLMWLGRFDEAVKESEKALQLDPLSQIIAADHCAIFYFSRQYDRAIEQCRSVLRKDPDFPRAGYLLIYTYVGKGMFEEALAEPERLQRLYGKGPEYWMALAYIYGRAGQTERARREMEKLEKLNRKQAVDPGTMLWAHLGVGDKEEALANLERAYAEHQNMMTTLKVEPAFDPLRSDPRFQDLMRRVHLAE